MSVSDNLFGLQGNRVEVTEHPVPEVREGDILVKTVAVAQNPTDWKCTHLIPTRHIGTLTLCCMTLYVSR